LVPEEVTQGRSLAVINNMKKKWARGAYEYALVMGLPRGNCNPRKKQNNSFSSSSSLSKKRGRCLKEKREKFKNPDEQTH